MNDTTHVLIILDRSGSMAGLAEDLRGGINTYINELRASEQENYTVSIVLFDGSDDSDYLCRDAPLAEVPALTSKNYFARGNTPLYDATGKAIAAVEHTGRVFVVTFTDGLENASREWTQGTVNNLIKVKEAQGWAFEYLGAGSDAWAEKNVGMYDGTLGGRNVRRGMQTASAYASMTADLGAHTTSYAATGAQELVTDEEREIQE